MSTKAKAWMKDGKVIIQTDTHQYQVEVSTFDLLNIRAGGSAEVELVIVDLQKK